MGSVRSRVPILVLISVVLLDMVVLGGVRVPGVWVLQFPRVPARVAGVQALPGMRQVPRDVVWVTGWRWSVLVIPGVPVFYRVVVPVYILVLLGWGVCWGGTRV